MPAQRKVIAFGVDRDTLTALRTAFPGWEVEGVAGGPLWRDAGPAAADLLVVGGGDREGDTLRLCRGLRGQKGRAATPLVVLLRPDQGSLVEAALEAGADSCLFLPIRAADLGAVVIRAQAGDRPGRHTGNLDRRQLADQWRDDGGEG